MDKRLIPLDILNAIEEELEIQSHKVFKIENASAYYEFVDDLIFPHFRFRIVKGVDYKPGHNKTKDSLAVSIVQSPSSSHDVGESARWCLISELQKEFQNWITVLEEYSSRSSIHDDPAVEAFRKEYFKKFNGSKFPKNAYFTEEQEDQYLILIDELREKISELKTQLNNTKAAILNEVEQQLDKMKEEVTNLTAKENINQVADVKAKLRKYSREIFKKLGGAVVNESFKQLTSSAIEHVPKVIQASVKMLGGE